MAFDTLPIELRRLILQELDNFHSLRAAIFTCRALYSAYVLKPSEAVTTTILTKIVGRDVLPEATIALASSHMRSHSSETRAAFITTYLTRRTVHPTPRSLAGYSHVEELDTCVRHLAQRFADDCLAKVDKRAGSAESSVAAPPSAGELARIRRALYRFETFRNIYHRKSPSQPMTNDSLSKFCLRFAPWENEQLGCILDFLFRIASPAFNEVAAHDITWGNLRIEPALFLGSISFQGVLSQGLIKIYNISIAESYEDRYSQLSSESPLARPDFLNRALRLTSRFIATSANPLGTFSLKDREEYIKQPFFNDPDTGPSVSWEREHLGELSTGFVYQSHHYYLRELGYVMWDRTRIALMAPFSILRDLHHGTGPNQEVSDMSWLASWKKRAAIFDRGGRGWWDFEDESKVIWPKEQLKIEKMGGNDDTAIQKSMGEATRALLSMTLPSSSSTRLSRQL